MASFRSIVGLTPTKPSISTSALIIVDAQNEYATGKLSISNVDASRKAISELLAAYRKHGGKIVHVVHQVPEGAPVFTPGTDLAMEFAELREKDGEAKIVKQNPSSFAGTDLEKILKGWGIKTVVICGYMAHVCVNTTARSASELGFEPIVVGDAVGDRDVPGAVAADLVKMSLVEVADAFGTVLNTREIIGAA